MTQELREEFDRYLETLSAGEDPFALPEYLTDYEIIACMQDNPQKKTFLLQSKNGRKMLCKFADGDFQMMLKTEHEITLAELFPFLPYIIDYRESENGAILLREYIEGRTLKELVEEEGPLNLEDALSIVREVCRCLMRLHDAKPALIHRDIKPSNIVWTKSGDCYLVDMGTLRRYQEGSSSDTFCMGTADFAAPEQFGARQTDVRTDIYGLGMLFYYLLTGRAKVQDNAFKGLPRAVTAFIRKCIAFNPDERYGDIHQVQRALSRLGQNKKHVPSRVIACVSSGLAAVLLMLLIIPKLHIGNEQIDFSSSLLEQAVRQELGKAEGEPIYRKDLKKIRCLKICGTMVLNEGNEHVYFSISHTVDDADTGHGDISDLSLLAQMPNLCQLTLDNQEIADITPLQKLPLVSLSLSGNPISDLTALSANDTLCELNISYTKVFSLEPLANCSNLQTLYCRSTQVKSLEPLANLPLVDLELLDTFISDFSPLESVSLHFLECSNITEDTLEDIKKISTLQRLNIYHSEIPTLEAFDGFDHIFFLGINYDGLRSLEGIENLPSLTMLSISNNPISECPALPTLRALMIDNTGIRDFSFLNEMPALTQITISEAQRPYLMEAVPEPWFIVENI